MKIWLNGRLVDRAHAVVNVFDHGLLYGDGVFEGIRVYNGRVFHSQAHLDRLYVSAKQIRLAIPYPKQELHEAMVETIKANNAAYAYIRLVVTRGEGTLGLSPFKCSKPSVIVIYDDIQLYPKEMYTDGMAVIVAKTIRTSARMVDPSVKSLNYLNNILAKIESVDAGVSEAIMLNEHGDVAEATGDNVFIVKNGTVITPPPSAGILVGITRAIVIELSKKLGIPLKESTIARQDLDEADECFLTGTAAEVCPVTRIDDALVGNGKVGDITRRLIKAYREFIDSDLRE